MLSLLICTTLAGCPNALPTDSEIASAGMRMTDVVTCTATPAQQRLVCTPVARHIASGVLDERAGNEQIRLATANVTADTMARVFEATVTVQNLLADPLGTSDGTAASGVKVFYVSGPTVTAFVNPGDTGTVTVRNADSTGNFTDARQPYYLYNQILQPGAVSAPKIWQWNWPSTVKSFSFQVKVFATSPGESPFPDIPPDSVPNSIYADSNVVVNPPGGAGTYVRDVVMLWFTREASREERTAAVQSVGGSLIGGDGAALYLIQVPRDTSIAPSIPAARRLRRLPQVKTAIPFSFLDLNYLRPQDGSGRERHDGRGDLVARASPRWVWNEPQPH